MFVYFGKSPLCFLGRLPIFDASDEEGSSFVPYSLVPETQKVCENAVYI